MTAEFYSVTEFWSGSDAGMAVMRESDARILRADTAVVEE
jgi:hypothetical protein